MYVEIAPTEVNPSTISQGECEVLFENRNDRSDRTHAKRQERDLPCENRQFRFLHFL